jgi:hypothetical protein
VKAAYLGKGNSRTHLKPHCVIMSLHKSWIIIVVKLLLLLLLLLIYDDSFLVDCASYYLLLLCIKFGGTLTSKQRNPLRSPVKYGKRQTLWQQASCNCDGLTASLRFELHRMNISAASVLLWQIRGHSLTPHARLCRLIDWVGFNAPTNTKRSYGRRMHGKPQTK